MKFNVFFSKALNDFVVGEMCKCGHLHRDHGSQLKKISDQKTLRLAHDGSCCVGKCACKHFRWARWVTATEFADTLPTKQEERLTATV